MTQLILLTHRLAILCIFPGIWCNQTENERFCHIPNLSPMPVLRVVPPDMSWNIFWRWKRIALKSFSRLLLHIDAILKMISISLSMRGFDALRPNSDRSCCCVGLLSNLARNCKTWCAWNRTRRPRLSSLLSTTLIKWVFSLLQYCKVSLQRVGGLPNLDYAVIFCSMVPEL